MKSTYIGRMMDQLWPKLQSKKCIYIGLQTVYKTNYSTFEGHFSIENECQLPFRYMRSANSAVFNDFLAKAGSYQDHIAQDNQLNVAGGISAAFLIHAEMYGAAALHLKLIVDQHFITTETLQSFAPLINGFLGVKFNFDEIYKSPNFKPVLKELNNKKHGIFN